MKRCPRCAETKPLTEFHKNPSRKDGVSSVCKPCRRLYDHERYERLQQRLIAYRPQRSERGRRAWLRGLKERKPCTDCGRVYPYQVMQWDHRPGFEKVGDLSEAFWGRSRDEVLAEIAKCDLVCANCHAIRTFARMSLKWLGDRIVTYEFAVMRWIV